MTKTEFLALLGKKLKAMPDEEIAEHLAFYSESIDDRMEDGLAEEEAVEQLGSVNEIAERIERDRPAPTAKREKRRLNTLEIVLLVLGCPIWISLLAAAFAVVVSLYAGFWSVMLALWVVDISVAVAAVAGFVGAGIFCFSGSITTGLTLLAAGLFCTGFAIFVFYGCSLLTKGLWWITKNFTLWVVKCIFRKDGRK